MNTRSWRIAVRILVVMICVGLLWTVTVAYAATNRAPHRPLAKKGSPLSPTDFPKNLLPGIEKLGAVPERQYVIAFSNGDMADVWRRTFVTDVMEWGKKSRVRQ